jgi:hypothetical protein
VKLIPIPNDFIYCTCHLGPSEDGTGLLLQGNAGAEVTVYPECYMHSHIVRMVQSGMPVRLDSTTGDDGKPVAVFSAIPAIARNELVSLDDRFPSDWVSIAEVDVTALGEEPGGLADARGIARAIENARRHGSPTYLVIDGRRVAVIIGVM